MDNDTLDHEQFLCNLDDLEELQAIELNVQGRQLFAIRKGDALHAYWNSCPHMGLPLNWVPGRFLNFDKEYLQCSAHGALFTISEGTCIAGPCVEDHLEPVKLRRAGNKFYISAEQPLPEPLINLREQALRALDD